MDLLFIGASLSSGGSCQTWLVTISFLRFFLITPYFGLDYVALSDINCELQNGKQAFEQGLLKDCETSTDEPSNT